MAYITPDLELLFGGYGQPQPKPEATDPSQVAQLVQQLAGDSSQQALLAELVRQGMTRGLGVTPEGPNAGLGFSGPVAGYAGSLRPSDVPGQQVGQLLPADKATEKDNELRARGMPFGNGKTLGDVMDLLGVMPKGTSGEVQGALLGQAGLLPQGEGVNRKDLTQRTREIMAARRQDGKSISIAEARKLAFQEEVDLAKARNENNTLPATVQKDLLTRETVSGALAQVRENFDDKFVGPERGRTFEIRREGLIKGDIPGDKEIKFRLALDDANDLILRARSGAQINEPEEKRLRRLLPQPTDDPAVFLPALDRFETKFNETIGRAIQLGTTPRGTLGAESGWQTGPGGLRYRKK